MLNQIHPFECGELDARETAPRAAATEVPVSQVAAVRQVERQQVAEYDAEDGGHGMVAERVANAGRCDAGGSAGLADVAVQQGAKGSRQSSRRDKRSGLQGHVAQTRGRWSSCSRAMPRCPARHQLRKSKRPARVSGGGQARRRWKRPR